MAPEQLRNLQDGATDHNHRADVYSLGMLLWQLLTGQPTSRTSAATVDAFAAELLESRLRPQPSVRDFSRHVPYAVASMVEKCLAPRPDDRYPSAEALREDLELQLADQPLRYASDVASARRRQFGIDPPPWSPRSAALGARRKSLFLPAEAPDLGRGIRYIHS